MVTKKSQACAAHPAQSQRKLEEQLHRSSIFGTMHFRVFATKSVRVVFTIKI